MALERPDLVRSLILMDTSAWSFQPPDEAIRTMVQDFITAFDPADGVPAALSIEGPEETLIEAVVPAEWQQEKDAILAGMDAYAIKGLGLELWAEADTVLGRCAAGWARIKCPVTVIVGEHDHPLVDQAPELAAEVATAASSSSRGRTTRHS